MTWRLFPGSQPTSLQPLLLTSPSLTPSALSYETDPPGYIGSNQITDPSQSFNILAPANTLFPYKVTLAVSKGVSSIRHHGFSPQIRRCKDHSQISLRLQVQRAFFSHPSWMRKLLRPRTTEGSTEAGTAKVAGGTKEHFWSRLPLSMSHCSREQRVFFIIIIKIAKRIKGKYWTVCSSWSGQHRMSGRALGCGDVSL